MKVMIVSLGLLIAGMTFVVFQGDMGRYMHIQTFLKANAEECAAGAALYYDEEAYSQGKMIICKEEAEKYVRHLVSEAGLRLSARQGGDLYYELIIADMEGDDLPDQAPCTQVILRYETEDLFRLPFLRVNQVIRSGKYELADYGIR
jgi:hypothetical protein